MDYCPWQFLVSLLVSLWVWKRILHFLPYEIIRFRRKKKGSSEVRNFYRRNLTNWARRLATSKNLQRSNVIFEGSRHPSFINHFEYGQSFFVKSFPKRFGTLSPRNSKARVIETLSNIQNLQDITQKPPPLYKNKYKYKYKHKHKHKSFMPNHLLQMWLFAFPWQLITELMLCFFLSQ